MKRVAFHTLGCKLNFSETSAISRMFEDHGYEKVDFEEKADVYVINTCSVTDNADKKCRQVVKQVRKRAPAAFISVIGCYAQLKPQEIASIPGVNAVLGASEKFKLLELLDFDNTADTAVHACEINEADTFHHAYSYNDRTRTFLKVQDGCDYNCSFCTIPLARGRSRSDSINNILKTAHDIAATEVNEVVLTGVNIGDFGKVNGRRKERFIDLIKALEQIEGIARLRISSIEPNLLTNEIIEYVAASEKFVPHFHIPLQSGNNRLLKEMRRRYKRELYADRVEKIKTVMPDCCIGVDVITGFPGEQENDFLDTYQFLNDLDVAYLHAFTYSGRPDTPAYKREDQVPKHIRYERTQMLRTLSAKKKRYFYRQHLGEERPVLFENEVAAGMMYGYTDNYIRVKVSYDPAGINTINTVCLHDIDEKGVVKADLKAQVVV